MKIDKNAILAALPGAERREGAQQGMSEFDMACRDGFCIRTRRVILYMTNGRANRVQALLRIFYARRAY